MNERFTQDLRAQGEFLGLPASTSPLSKSASQTVKCGPHRLDVLMLDGMENGICLSP
jgi:hypothetical protein